MTSHSPFRLVAAGLLRTTSFPVWLAVNTWRKRLINRSKVVKVELSSQNSTQWSQGSSAWNSLLCLNEEKTVSTIWLVLKDVPRGWSTIWAFRDLLRTLKASGKSIFVLIETSDARALWMTACADKIWVQHGVELFWAGIGGRHNFYGALLDKYGIQADVEAAGAFKSFGESYVRTEPSEENRTQLLALYTSLLSELLSNLKEDTGLDESTIHDLLYQTPISSDRLVDVGLIVGEGDVHSVKERVYEYTDNKSITVDFSTYQRWSRWADWWQWGQIGTVVAVVHLHGSISDFDTNQDGIVADKVVRQLDALAKQDWIEAVVLNINSPGGSAIASDRIARAVERLKTHKKVVAYMGSVAASGGYYISAVTDWIWASPQTITGSIGVVGGKLVLGRALEEQGVRAHTLSVGGESGFLDWWSPFDDLQRERFRAFLQRTYIRFSDVVSKGRRMPKEAVEEVAQGRVWTGTQACENGLVDRLGTLEDSLQDLAGHLQCSRDSLQLVHLRNEVRGWKKLRKKWFGIQMPQSIEEGLLKRAPLLVQSIAESPSEALLLLPFDIEA